ncbi:hypothetical protein PPROV_000143200 [Pycnococcus provasolii]|uniref:VOC domain-containing protein n=1 Tax=Pycnococcus provasolii TaxID=41880 RepID=A0A830HC61_9CHLO|nr:hypothetical protein PPROV_000143200 [Pycnococcus provasolii]|mmetsp:Transcript_7035/g.18218  ORF Transcript_7035/g.18218 Transcript_7035/m.18218 type:complete len:127 (+) Transcript_7035:2-382(+)
MSARWRFLMLLTRNVPKSAEFYRGGLGLTVTSLTETWAEIQVPGGTKLVLKQTDAEAMASTGYSPLITLDVDDLDDVVPNALQHGATLDGPIRHEPSGKAAALRSPCGHMIGLFETPTQQGAGAQK